MREVVGFVLAFPRRETGEVLLEGDAQGTIGQRLLVCERYELARAPLARTPFGDEYLDHPVAEGGADLTGAGIASQAVNETHAGCERHALLDQPLYQQCLDLSLCETQPQRRPFDPEFHVPPLARSATASIRCACSRCGRSIMRPSRLTTPAAGAVAKAATTRCACSRSASVGANAALIAAI